MIGQGFNNASLGMNKQYQSQITPEIIVQALKANLESGKVKSNTKDPDYQAYLDKLTKLAEQESQARQQSTEPRQKGDLEKYGVPIGIGAAGLIAALSGNRGVDRAMGGIAGGLLGIPGAKNRSYQANQDRKLTNDLGSIGSQRDALKTQYDIAQDQYTAGVNADNTAYTRNRDSVSDRNQMLQSEEAKRQYEAEQAESKRLSDLNYGLDLRQENRLGDKSQDNSFQSFQLPGGSAFNSGQQSPIDWSGNVTGVGVEPQIETWGANNVMKWNKLTTEQKLKIYRMYNP